MLEVRVLTGRVLDESHVDVGVILECWRSRERQRRRKRARFLDSSRARSREQEVDTGDRNRRDHTVFSW